MNIEEELYKKDFLKWLRENWVLYASEYNDKKHTRIRMYNNGFGEYKISEQKFEYGLVEKIVYKGKDINKAITTWFNLKK